MIESVVYVAYLTYICTYEANKIIAPAYKPDKIRFTSQHHSLLCQIRDRFNNTYFTSDELIG
ncbi:hypothetical protein GCM10028807_39220 [Spirosoma daeguense]